MLFRGWRRVACESIDSGIFLHNSLPDMLKHGLLLNIVLAIVVSLGRLASQLAPRIFSLCLLFSGMTGGLSHPPGSFMGAGDPCTQRFCCNHFSTYLFGMTLTPPTL